MDEIDIVMAEAETVESTTEKETAEVSTQTCTILTDLPLYTDLWMVTASVIMDWTSLLSFSEFHRLQTHRFNTDIVREGICKIASALNPVANVLSPSLVHSNAISEALKVCESKKPSSSFHRAENVSSYVRQFGENKGRTRTKDVNNAESVEYFMENPQKNWKPSILTKSVKIVATIAVSSGAQEIPEGKPVSTGPLPTVSTGSGAQEIPEGKPVSTTPHLSLQSENSYTQEIPKGNLESAATIQATLRKEPTFYRKRGEENWNPCKDQHRRKVSPPPGFENSLRSTGLGPRAKTRHVSSKETLNVLGQKTESLVVALTRAYPPVKLLDARPNLSSVDEVQLWSSDCEEVNDEDEGRKLGSVIKVLSTRDKPVKAAQNKRCIARSKSDRAFKKFKEYKKDSMRKDVISKCSLVVSNDQKSTLFCLTRRIGGNSWKLPFEGKQPKLTKGGDLRRLFPANYKKTVEGICLTSDLEEMARKKAEEVMGMIEEISVHGPKELVRDLVDIKGKLEIWRAKWMTQLVDSVHKRVEKENTEITEILKKKPWSGTNGVKNRLKGDMRWRFGGTVGLIDNVMHEIIKVNHANLSSNRYEYVWEIFKLIPKTVWFWGNLKDKIMFD